MRLKRQVSNQEFQEAYELSDNIGIIKEITSRYRNILDESDRESCGMQGLWEALVNHEENRGQKFTTSLFRYVTWRCDNCVRRIKKVRKGEVSFTDYTSCPTNRSTSYQDFVQPETNQDDRIGEIYELADRYLSKEDRDILMDIAINGESVEEVSRRTGISKCRIRSKYSRAKKYVKELSAGV